MEIKLSAKSPKQQATEARSAPAIDKESGQETAPAPAKSRWPFATDYVRVTKRERVLQKKSTAPAPPPKARAAPVTYELADDLPVNALIRVRNEDGKTINAHQAVVGTKGAVLFGKFGAALGADFSQQLNNQVAAGRPTYLFVTTREGWGGPYVTYQCKLVQVHNPFPVGKEDLVPPYLQGQKSLMTTWFEISTCTRMTKAEMNKIYVASSKREIMSVISTSATLFKVVVAQAATRVEHNE